MVNDTLGRPMHDLRVSVTDRCNFRCPYCMPVEKYGAAYQFLRRDQILSFEEITRLTRLMTGLGVTKVRLTGGEPLLREGLPVLVEQLSRVEGIHDLTLTTNGYFLAAQARALKQAGLHRVTVSLDSLDEVIFHKMNGRSHGPGQVLDGIKTAAELGLSPIKINVVVQRGLNDAGIVDLARHFRGTGHILRFIEFMDVGNVNDWKLSDVVPADEIISRINAIFPLEPTGANYRGEVALRYRYRDGGGEIGFIASVTRPFCSDCTRARLSTDGKLFTCLFGTVGTDLKGPMRSGASDEELVRLITDTWRRRGDRYSDERATRTGTLARKIEMYQIGG